MAHVVILLSVIALAGGVVLADINKSATLLVVGDNSRDNSRKKEHAKELGIEIWTEAQWKSAAST